MANTDQLHMRLPQQVSARLTAYCDATGRRRSDVIIQLIMDLEPPGEARQPRTSGGQRASAGPVVRSPHFLSRAPDMVVIQVQQGSRTKGMIFSRPNRLSDQWVWCILWRKGIDVPGYDIETRPIPEHRQDMDIWALIESGEAVAFDREIPEHRALAQWPAGKAPQTVEEYERDAARQAERFDRYVQDISSAAEPIAALED